MIKLLIGGSPCTYWSIAQKNNRETEAKGLGWELFKNYLIAKKKFNPDYFLYENNKSASQAIKNQISHELEVPLMHINSALVSAQNRQRFYAFNWFVEEPEDRGIKLRDILETGNYSMDSEPLLVQEATKKGYAVIKPGECVDLTQPHSKTRRGRKMVTKSNCLLTSHEYYEYIGRLSNVGNCQTIEKAIPKRVDKYGYLPEKFNAYNLAEIEDKSPTLSTGSMVTSSCATTLFVKSPDGSGYPVHNGQININGSEYPIKVKDGQYILRKLTPIECERLQTLPDGYTKAVSDAQRYKGIGNGWTAEVIIHILNGALKQVSRDEEIVVLSMYDGIGTGRYCLDKMGFTNVKYFAYEIDKFAKQIAMSNYPDIIQLGDAFDLRNPDWIIGY